MRLGGTSEKGSIGGRLFRKRFGDLSVFRYFEAFENGHLHIRLIAVFKEQYFRVFKSYEQDKDGKVHKVWLVEEKEFFEPYWHSWTKIEAVAKGIYDEGERVC